MLQKQLLKALCYFDIFEHPLKEEELINFCANENTKFEVLETLKQLTKEEVVFSYNNFYSIRPEIQSLFDSRSYKEEIAKLYFKKLPFYAGIIRRFPFVRGIAISGSLSKKVMHEKGDIDYFIITKAGRLWICRTLLVLFKKIVLLNSRKYFCLNYFVDENNLEIIDKNIFTAIEVIYLLPIYNKLLISQFKKTNSWITQYFPSFETELTQQLDFKKRKKFNVLEAFFAGKFGDYIDLFFMKITHKHWSKKFNSFSLGKLELTMRSNRGVSKHHPLDFQTKVLEAFNDRWKTFYPDEQLK